jgi:hypothetical protein
VNIELRGMVSTGRLPRVALVRTAVSEALGSSETTVLTRATRRNIPEDTILHSHCRENLKSYIKLRVLVPKSSDDAALCQALLAPWTLYNIMEYGSVRVLTQAVPPLVHCSVLITVTHPNALAPSAHNRSRVVPQRLYGV